MTTSKTPPPDYYDVAGPHTNKPQTNPDGSVIWPDDWKPVVDLNLVYTYTDCIALAQEYAHRGHRTQSLPLGDAANLSLVFSNLAIALKAGE